MNEIMKGASLTFLIIEDNPGDFFLVEDYISEMFAAPNIVHADNYKQALIKLTDNSYIFDVILLDLSLPDNKGNDLIKGILNVANEVPVIALTGYENLDFSIGSIAIGIIDYLLKDEINSYTLYKSVLFGIERKKQTKIIIDSERKYNELFNLSPIPMWVYETNSFKILDVNQSAIEHYGFSSAEFKEKTLLDFFPDNDTKDFLDLKSTPNTSTIEKHVKKSGEIIDVKVEKSPFFIGEKACTIMLSNDITELLSTQKSLKSAYQSADKERTQALRYQSRLLSAQINPHFLFNALNSVQYYILCSEIEPALEFVSEFAKLIRATLKNSLDDKISLKEETKFLTAYLNLEQTRFKNNFEYTITFADSIDDEDLYIPPMLLQPYLENTVIHGVGNLQEKGKIEIDFIDEGTNILCSIDDNGVGRERALSLRALSKGADHVSLATDLTALRIDTLNKIENGNYSSKIIDKKAENGMVIGTRVEVRFPKISYD